MRDSTLSAMRRSLVPLAPFSLLFLLIAATIRAIVPGEVWERDETLWRDTVIVPREGSLTFRSRFLDFTGKTVLHCHMMNHEELGMMQHGAGVPGLRADEEHDDGQEGGGRGTSSNCTPRLPLSRRGLGSGTGRGPGRHGLA